MANARPYTDAHAVMGVDIAVLFDDKLTSNQLARLGASFEAEMVKHGLAVSKGRSGDNGSRLAFEKTDANGSVIEDVHIHENFVHVIQKEYRGWTLTRDTALERLSPLLDLLPDNELPVCGVGMSFRDAFLVDDPRQYEINDVFKPNIYLPQFVFEGGRFWQTRSEWADSDPPDPWNRRYSQLTVDARVRSSSEKGDDSEDSKDFLHVTQLTHRQQMVVWDVENLAKLKWGGEEARRWLDCLHDRNKILVKALLNDAMLEKIGLKE